MKFIFYFSLFIYCDFQSKYFICLKKIFLNYSKIANNQKNDFLDFCLNLKLDLVYQNFNFC